ncbi:MAG: hypothetical protein AAF674_20695 [Pseudomonadota bacterium]
MKRSLIAVVTGMLLLAGCYAEERPPRPQQCPEPPTATVPPLPDGGLGGTGNSPEQDCLPKANATRALDPALTLPAGVHPEKSA